MASKKILASTIAALALICGAISGAESASVEGLLAEIRSGKGFFYNTVIAQAQSIDVSGDIVTFAFLPTHRALREQLEQNRAWIEAAAARVAGRKITVATVQVESGGLPAAAKPADSEPTLPTGKRDLKAEAMSSAKMGRLPGYGYVGVTASRRSGRSANVRAM